MTSKVKGRIQKAGLPPGTAIYTGIYRQGKPHLNLSVYNASEYSYISEATLEQCLTQPEEGKATWIKVVGLQV